MTQIRRLSDIMRSAMDDMAIGLDYFTPRTFTYGGTLVDTEKYDIVPKPSYYDDLIRQAGEQIEALDRQHESDDKYYKTRRAKLVEEKEKLIRNRDKRKIKSG